MVSRTKERALDPLLVPALLGPGHAVNMLTELTDERRSKRHPGRSIDAAPRHCAPLPAALPSARASELSNLACRLRPASRTVAGRCPNMCELSYGARLSLARS
eukprot:scaffold101806_cov48-Phaeocystis_antarctica.AAC.2